MFSPNKWVRRFSFFPGLLIIGFLLFEGVIIPEYFLPSLHYVSLGKAIFNYAHFFVFLWFYILCFWSYFACVFTHPGPVTDSYLADYEEQYGQSQMRYCGTCRSAKPPRCHHCSICRMCVVNMDHHCPWFCNCIGYQNKKYFILFLFYAWIGCLDISFIVTKSFFFSSTISFYSLVHYKQLIFLCGIVAFSFCFTLTFFGGFHVWMVFNDKTTIEMNGIFRDWFRRSNQNHHHKVDYCDNWCMVMDSPWYYWFIPIHAKSFQFEWGFMNQSDNEFEVDPPSQDEMIRLIDRNRTYTIPQV